MKDWFVFRKTLLDDGGKVIIVKLISYVWCPVYAYLCGGWNSVGVFVKNKSELSVSPYNISSSSSVLSLYKTIRLSQAHTLRF
jgi:hypothetical protein